MENQQIQYEDEIDLMDYIRVIWRRKRAILAIFLAVVIISGVISLILPQTFEATNLVRIGQIKEKPLETIDDVKVVFERRNILESIAQKIGLTAEDPEVVAKLFSIEAVRGTDLLKIKGRGRTPAKAVEVSNAVTEILIERHQKLFAKAEETFNTEKETIVKNREKIEKDIEQIEKDIARLESDIKVYEKEIQIRANAQSEAQGRIVQSYINLLANAKNQKEDKNRQILDLEKQIVNLDQALQQKEYERVYQTRPTEIEVPAVLPKTRVAPKRRQIVMIAAVLGLFIAILYAFIAEYWQKNKDKLKSI